MLGKTFQPNLMFSGKARANPGVEYQKALHLGKILDLPTNIRLGWEGLPDTNTVAYYKKFINYGRKIL